MGDTETSKLITNVGTSKKLLSVLTMVCMAEYFAVTKIWPTVNRDNWISVGLLSIFNNASVLLRVYFDIWKSQFNHQKFTEHYPLSWLSSIY